MRVFVLGNILGEYGNHWSPMARATLPLVSRLNENKPFLDDGSESYSLIVQIPVVVISDNDSFCLDTKTRQSFVLRRLDVTLLAPEFKDI